MLRGGRPVPPLVLSRTERELLTDLVARSASRPLVLRSRIVLACATGRANVEVATELGVTAATVGKWRRRFVSMGVTGLRDGVRSGRPRATGVAAAERQQVGTVEVAPQRRAPEAGRAAPGRAYDALRAWMVRGELAPGMRVADTETARVLGVEPAAARSALDRLVREGLLTRRPGRGTVVAEVPEADARAAREARHLLETAAARRMTGRLSDQELAELHAHVDQMREAAQRADVLSFREADLAFHRTVCAFSGNPMLLRMWLAVEPALWTLQVVASAWSTRSRLASADRHRELVRALAGSDPGEAARLFSAHLRGDPAVRRPRTPPGPG